MYNSTIATNGESSVFSTPFALNVSWLSVSVSTVSAAAAANDSAQSTGTARHTANARPTSRAIHGVIGHNTAANGIPTNSRIVDTLTTIFSSNSPRNSRLAA